MYGKGEQPTVIYNNKRAEMGVGTLIIFIALILVAAVAAGVVIQTAGSLQQQALSTGQAARGEIATSARVIEVSAVDGSAGTVENFTVQMKLAPGSNPIKLDEVTLTLNTDNTTSTLNYFETANATDAQTLFNAADFTIEYLITGTNFVAGNLQRGDVIAARFSAPRQITEDEAIRINFIPKIGTATLVQFNMPDVVSTERVYLYP